MSSQPKVQVLISSYNGEKYIEEQVQSILNQRGVQVEISVRDDGSQDGTVRILESFRTEHSDTFHIILGENLGYRRSFLKLLAEANPDADYYAYADQDDYWDPDKLIAAIEELKKDRRAWLYASALKIADSKLNVLSVKHVSDLRQCLGSFFVRTRLAGCTMVFTPEMKKIAQKYANLKVSHQTAPDHDALLCMLSMLYGRKIVIDDNAHILHRRHEDTETSGGRGVTNRVKVELKRIFSRKNSFQYIAQQLLQEPVDWERNTQAESNHQMLMEIASYNQSIKCVLQVCRDRRISCGIKAADALIRVKMLLQIY